MLDNLSLYRVFYRVAMCKSISAAARELYLTQPAVSASVQKLEDQLNIQLFFRTGRGVSLTPQGEILFSYIERAFALVESGEGKLRDITALHDGILRIGASDMTLRFYLLDRLQAFHETYPGVQLHVTNAPTPDTLDALRAGQIDFGVISGPLSSAASADEELSYRPVRHIRDIFIESTQAPPRKTAVSAKELLSMPLILLEGHTSTRAYIDSWFASHCGGSVPRAAIELATSDLILAFAARGIGVGCIAEDFALDAIACGQVREIPLSDELPTREFYLVTLKHIPLSAAAEAFLHPLS